MQPGELPVLSVTHPGRQKGEGQDRLCTKAVSLSGNGNGVASGFVGADPDQLRQLPVSAHAPGPGGQCQQECPALVLLPKSRGSTQLALDVLL